MVSARIGPLFTGGAVIEIASDGWPLKVGADLIWDTGWYILGQWLMGFFMIAGSLLGCSMLK